MNFRRLGKQVVETVVPARLGQLLAHVPYSLRLGSAYVRSQHEQKHFAGFDTAATKTAILQRVRAIVTRASQTTAFYHDLYRSCGADGDCLQRFEDIQSLPIVSRGELQSLPLCARSKPSAGAMLVNTGGSSGSPLEFYVDRHAFAREWAHMLKIWERLGYRPSCLKLTFRGKDLGSGAVRYNCVHNEYQVNAYCPMESRATGVASIAAPISFLHGYPSAIYEFVRYCRDSAPHVLARLRGELRGVLLGSEYPAPAYRKLIESELNVPSISWYGHSEFSVLAAEIEPFLYQPFNSYGFCEAVADDAGGYRLVATSYYNTASPFIRYDTGDRIEPIFSDGLVSAFRVTSGRVGEFIEDRAGDRISLTALIFGRHHGIFGVAHFVQVMQNTPGKATLIVTLPPGGKISKEDVLSRFDLRNVAIHFNVEVRREPVRTMTGKVPLLIRSECEPRP